MAESLRRKSAVAAIYNIATGFFEVPDDKEWGESIDESKPIENYSKPKRCFRRPVTDFVTGPVGHFLVVCRIFGCSRITTSGCMVLKTILRLYSALALLAAFGLLGVAVHRTLTSTEPVISQTTFALVSAINLDVFLIISLFWSYHIERKVLDLAQHAMKVKFSIQEGNDCWRIIKTKCRVYVGLCLALGMGTGVATILVGLGYMNAPLKPLVPSRPVVSAVVAFLLGSFKTGSVTCVVAAQDLLVQVGRNILGRIEKNILNLDQLDVDTVKDLRIQFLHAKSVLVILDQMWTYYYFILQAVIVIMDTIGLYMVFFGEGQVHVFISFWLFFLTLSFLATFIGPISLNETYELLPDKFLSKESELDQSGSVMVPDLSERLEYNHHVKMLLDQMKDKTGYMTSGYVFVLSRGSFVTIVTIIASYFALIAQFRLEWAGGLKNATNSSLM